MEGEWKALSCLIIIVKVGRGDRDRQKNAGIYEMCFVQISYKHFEIREVAPFVRVSTVFSRS